MATTTTTITSENIAEFFKVTDGTYKFASSADGVFAASNTGVNSSTATTTLTALEDMTVTLDYSLISESGYDKMTLTMAGSTKLSAISGTKSGSIAATALTTGQNIVMTYSKDSSQHETGEKATFLNMQVTVETATVMTAEEFNALKTRAKAEMKRRCYNGSLASYATSTAADASAGSGMGADQGHDLMDGILTAMDVGSLSIAGIASGAVITTDFSNKKVGAALTALESVSATSSASGCKSSCSGLCQGNCSTGCSGCDGCSGCGGACSYSCSGDCEGSCSGGCSGSCSGSCTGGCTNCSGCSSSCYPDDCTSGCYPSCSAGCSEDCASWLD